MPELLGLKQKFHMKTDLNRKNKSDFLEVSAEDYNHGSD